MASVLRIRWYIKPLYIRFFFPPYMCSLLFLQHFVLKSIFFYSQYEAKMKTLETNMKEMESKKRILEEAVDSLNEEIAKLKAKGNGNYLLVSCMTSCFFFVALNSSLVRETSETQSDIVALKKSLLCLWLIVDFHAKIQIRIEASGPLHEPVTWYKICVTGWQATPKQRKAKKSPAWLVEAALFQRLSHSFAIQNDRFCIMRSVHAKDPSETQDGPL